jgi:hypothetical protein
VGTGLKALGWALLWSLAMAGAARAQTTTITVDNSSAWVRSDGGTGTTMPAGGPAIWNSRFTATIPAGATNISFTLDTFFPDDKGVVQLNGTTIGDGVIFFGNGTAAGPGTFDFGLGGGNQPYTYVGFTPGTATALPNGTTGVTVVVYMNDTGVADPFSPPLSQTFISGFTVSGSLSYTLAPPPARVATPVPTLSEWALILLAALMAAVTLLRMRRRHR